METQAASATSLPQERATATAELGQGERIVDFSLTEEERAASTLLQLGLRVQNLTLPQDPTSAQLQEEALDINEHTTLYPVGDTERRQSQQRPRAAVKDFFRQFAAVPNRSINQSSVQGQAQLSQYFTSLPPESPLRSQLPDPSTLTTKVSASPNQRHYSTSSDGNSTAPLHRNNKNLNIGQS